MSKELLNAVLVGDLNKIKDLIENHKVPVNSSSTYSDFFNTMTEVTAFHIACKTGNIKVVDYLISKGANINAVHSLGWNGLHIALLFDNYKLAIKLIELEIDFTAITKDNYDIMKILDNKIEHIEHFDGACSIIRYLNHSRKLGDLFKKTHISSYYARDPGEKLLDEIQKGDFGKAKNILKYELKFHLNFNIKILRHDCADSPLWAAANTLNKDNLKTCEFMEYLLKLGALPCGDGMCGRLKIYGKEISGQEHKFPYLKQFLIAFEEKRKDKLQFSEDSMNTKSMDKFEQPSSHKPGKAAFYFG